MMKLGEAANRLSRLDILAPQGVDWSLAGADGVWASRPR
jgi:hypothetical protein